MTNSLRQLVLATFAAAIAIGYPHSALAQRRPLAFPVVVERPVFAQEGVLADGDRVLTQRVTPLGAVRLTAAYQVTYRPRVLDRVFTRNRERTVTLPSGTIMAMAIRGEEVLYCAPGQDRPEGYLTFFDVGVCFRDDARDGVFDQAALIEPSTRVRTAFEILAPEELTWAETSTGYAEVQPPDIPAGEVRLTYRRTGRIFGGLGYRWVSAELCWPDELVLATGRNGERTSCGGLMAGVVSSDPQRPLSHAYGPLGLRDARAGPEVTLRSRQFTLSIVPLEDGRIRLTRATSAMPAELAAVAAMGVWRTAADYRSQTTVYDILPLGPRPPQPTAVLGSE